MSVDYKSHEAGTPPASKDALKRLVLVLLGVWAVSIGVTGVLGQVQPEILRLIPLSVASGLLGSAVFDLVFGLPRPSSRVSISLFLMFAGIGLDRYLSKHEEGGLLTLAMFGGLAAGSLLSQLVYWWSTRDTPKGE